MTRFAFYGRVSTEDQQDPESSKAWQLARARQILPDGDEIVAEFFDVGMSRSLPWKRRPEATRLLEALRDPARGFDAIVIGEPHRAFYGAQFALTFPVLTHYGVELWVPEVGGRVDPGSEAHDLVMGLFGGMSKGERQRIKMRVRTAMTAQAATGRFLGGRPPYGYTLVDDGPHPNPGKAAAGQRAHRLDLDPLTAPVVRRIFEEYLAGAGLFTIAEGLTRDGIPCPSAYDRARNRHRTGDAWGKSAVRAILGNPKYVGRHVWNRQRRDEVLVDVDDVALGHATKLRWNDESVWVWSAEQTHPAIIDSDTFALAQRTASAGTHRQPARKRPTPRPYMLRGIVFCGCCDRRMEGAWRNSRAMYRCKVGHEYALAKGSTHPPTVYVREHHLTDALDEWLGQLFDLDRVDDTVRLLAASQDLDEGAGARAEAARRTIADCDTKLAKYRSALEAGADPKLVAAWIAETQGQRLAAERTLVDAQPPDVLSAEDVRALIAAVDVRQALADGDPAMKAKVYADLGVRLVYRPERRSVLVTAAPLGRVPGCVSEGRDALQGHAPVLRAELPLGA